MKHHIAIKFIAVLLCALTLMGAAGSAVGIFVMSEMDLYDKTVEQVRTERLLSGSDIFAHEAASRYASQTLGGCPEEMLENHFGRWMDGYYRDGQYSYSILDSEGNVVYSYGETGEEATAYTIPVTGKYLHLVSQETASEMEERQRATAASYSANFTIGDDARIMDALPSDGKHISFVSLCEADGTIVYEAYDDDSVGFLYYNKEGRVTFVGSQYVEDLGLLGNTIAGATFHDQDGTVVYEATASDGVGVVSFNDAGQLIFTAGIDENVTVAPAAQAPVVQETDQTAAAEIIPIFYVVFLNGSDELVYEAYGEMSIGFLTVNLAGKALYHGYRQEKARLDENVVITDAYFYGYNETLIYEVSSAEGVGSVNYSNLGQMEFISSDPAPEFNPVVMEETEPEEAEETEETEETQAEEEEEKEPSSASDIPDQTENTEAVTEPTAAAEETEVTEATEAAAVTEAPAETAAAAAIAEPAAYKAESQAEAVPAEPELINGKPLEEYDVETNHYYSDQQQEYVYVNYVRLPMPEYTVVLHLAPNALGMEGEYQLLNLLMGFSGYLFPALGICLLVFAICAVYLCCSAGRKPGSEEVRAGGLNRLPLDLYTGLAFLGVVLAANIGVEMGWYRLEDNFLFSCILTVAMAFLASLILVAYCYAVVAQVKTPGSYWLRNSLVVRFIMVFMHVALWLEKFLERKFFPAFGRLCKAVWKLTYKAILGFFHLWEKFVVWFLAVIRRFFHWLYERLRRFFSLIPLTWQWMIAGFSALFLVFITVAGRFDMGIVLSILYTIALILYASHCFGLLSESTKRMSKGDLETKVEDKLLLGCFKDFADDLNDLADVAVVAAQKQLKSERMKTELITNVSHDIKTPLTSIINYVDLLQKPHTEQEQEQYLEVLERQSLRLKKLIDDLMEMSKASTGNMAVEITTVDAVESVNQALGEFSDKLAAAQLTPMFRHAESRVAMRADGKLVWRVLSNILSNAVKYAMPGTRLYIDLMELEGKVVISLKNISREELNVDAEELMERFVRGDDSRNTEGSGLGLNIAKSLMELQKGQLQLLVDGDLFKVTLIFPGV